MTIWILLCIVIPLILLIWIVARPSMLMTWPSLVVDLVIGIIVILPIVAIRLWRTHRG
jgi:hypothetical protein